MQDGTIEEGDWYQGALIDRVGLKYPDYMQEGVV